MPKLKETDEVSDKLEETKDIKLPQETVAPQQETQTPQETTVSKDSIVAALKDEVQPKTEVPAPQPETQTPQETAVSKDSIAAAVKNETIAQQEVPTSQPETQTSQETAVTTDDIADALKKTNTAGDVSPRRPLKTDYSTVLWGKAADEVNHENKDINQFVQDLEQKGLTPEQYLVQKRAEYAALDDPLRKEGQEPQATSVTTDGIAGALKKANTQRKEVVAPPQEVQEPRETTVTTDDIAGALKKEIFAKTEVPAPQQEVQEPQETTVAKDSIAAALKKETTAKTEVPAPQQETKTPQETTVAKDSIAAALKKKNTSQQEVTPLQQEAQETQDTTPTKGGIAQVTVSPVSSLSKGQEDLLREVQLERQRDTLAKEAEADARLLDERMQNNGSKVSKEHKTPQAIVEEVDRINSVRYATEVANAQYPNKGTDLPYNSLKGVVGEGAGYAYLQDRLIDQIYQEAKATKSVVESEKISDIIANRITRHPENLKTTDGHTIKPDYAIKNSDGVIEEIVDSKAFSLLNPTVAGKIEEWQIENIEGTIEKYSKADLPGLKQITILAPYEFATTPRIKEQIESMSRRGINVRLEFSTSETGRNQMVNDIRHAPKPGQPPSPEQLNRLREIQKLPDDARRQAFSKFLDEIPSAPSETGRSKKSGQKK